MARRSALRASDEDREHVARRLRDATAEGRLLASELEERLSALFASRTYGELDGLVADLPSADPRRRRHTPLWMRVAFVVAVVLAVLAVLATIAVLLLGLAGAWVAWMAVAWFVFGRGRRVRRGGCSRRARVVRGGALHL